MQPLGLTQGAPRPPWGSDVNELCNGKRGHGPTALTSPRFAIPDLANVQRGDLWEAMNSPRAA